MELVNFSRSQFPQLRDEQNDNYIKALSWGLNNLKCVRAQSMVKEEALKEGSLT